MTPTVIPARLRLEDGATALMPLPVEAAEAFAAAVVANRAHTEPWEPIHGERHYSVAGQRDVLRRDETAWNSALGYAFGVLDASDSDRIIGRITLANVVYGAWRNATLGYWIAADVGGRGHATRAVGLICRFGFSAARLHRIQPAVVPRNVRSRRVLEKNGFRLEGRALRYLNIAGRWEDHDLYGLTSEEFVLGD
jgi:ribosomal-protein-alanine N-acetyltransferase